MFVDPWIQKIRGRRATGLDIPRAPIYRPYRPPVAVHNNRQHAGADNFGNLNPDDPPPQYLAAKEMVAESTI